MQRISYDLILSTLGVFGSDLLCERVEFLPLLSIYMRFYEGNPISFCKTRSSELYASLFFSLIFESLKSLESNGFPLKM